MGIDLTSVSNGWQLAGYAIGAVMIGVIGLLKVRNERAKNGNGKLMTREHVELAILQHSTTCDKMLRIETELREMRMDSNRRMESIEGHVSQVHARIDQLLQSLRERN